MPQSSRAGLGGLLVLMLAAGSPAAPLSPGAGLAQQDAGDEAAKKEVARLEGVWKVTALTFNGKDFFANGQAGFEFVIKGDEVLVQGNDKVKKEYARLRLKLEPSTMPKFADLTITAGVQKDAKLEGIYELKDDEFKLCVKVFGVDRPSEFAAPGGSSQALLVLKKEKK